MAMAGEPVCRQAACPPRPEGRNKRERNHPRRKRNEGGRPALGMRDSKIDYLLSCSKRTERQRLDERAFPLGFFLRKEVIQPQVPLRLPCYDFTPVADPTVVACLLAVSTAPSGKTNSHGVTGGVYKARERIHRSMLICDY